MGSCLFSKDVVIVSNPASFMRSHPAWSRTEKTTMHVDHDTTSDLTSYGGLYEINSGEEHRGLGRCTPCKKIRIMQGRRWNPRDNEPFLRLMKNSQENLEVKFTVEFFFLDYSDHKLPNYLSKKSHSEILPTDFPKKKTTWCKSVSLSPRFWDTHAMIMNFFELSC